MPGLTEENNLKWLNCYRAAGITDPDANTPFKAGEGGGGTYHTVHLQVVYQVRTCANAKHSHLYFLSSVAPTLAGDVSFSCGPTGVTHARAHTHTQTLYSTSHHAFSRDRSTVTHANNLPTQGAFYLHFWEDSNPTLCSKHAHTVHAAEEEQLATVGHCSLEGPATRWITRR